jgi:DNA-binding response OmpR family regulator
MQTSTDDRDPPLVILAEDDGELRRLVSLALARRGCMVLEATTGLELAQLIMERGIAPLPGTSRSAEIVISDVRMPGVTGLEIAGLMHEVQWWLPMILVTAFGDDATHTECARLGIRVFDKPFDVDELVAAACLSLGL